MEKNVKNIIRITGKTAVVFCITLSILIGLLYLTAEVKSESAIKSVTINRSGEDTSNPTTQTFDWSETDIPGVTNGKIAWYRSGKVVITDDNEIETEQRVERKMDK